MIIPDTNLLLYAHVPSFREHSAARNWLEDLLNSGKETLGLPWQVKLYSDRDKRQTFSNSDYRNRSRPADEAAYRASENDSDALDCKEQPRRSRGCCGILMNLSDFIKRFAARFFFCFYPFAGCFLLRMTVVILTSLSIKNTRAH